MIAILALLLYDYSFTVAGYRVTWQFLGLNILIVSLAFSYLSAIDYSLAILMPQHGSLADITKRIGTTVMGGGEGSDGVAAEPEPEPELEPVPVADEKSGEPNKSE